MVVEYLFLYIFLSYFFLHFLLTTAIVVLLFLFTAIKLMCLKTSSLYILLYTRYNRGCWLLEPCWKIYDNTTLSSGLVTITTYCSPEGSATSSISGANPATAQHCTDQSAANVPGNPKPPPGYGDDHSGSFSSQRTASAASAVGKWPLKPGVLVHSKQQLHKSQSANHSQTTAGDTADKSVSDESDKQKSKKNHTGKGKPAAECIMLANETQSARAARIRRMMIGSNNNLVPKKPSPTSPPPAPPVRQSSDNGASGANRCPPSTGRKPTAL